MTITYEWLRSRGFRLETPVIYDPHMVIALIPRDETHLEVAPSLAHPTQWHCWLRSDMSHRKARFCHIRMLTACEEVEQIFEALAGRKLSVEFRAFDQIAKFAEIVEDQRAAGRAHWKSHGENMLDTCLRIGL